MFNLHGACNGKWKDHMTDFYFETPFDSNLFAAPFTLLIFFSVSTFTPRTLPRSWRANAKEVCIKSRFKWICVEFRSFLPLKANIFFRVLLIVVRVLQLSQCNLEVAMEVFLKCTLHESLI